MKQFKVVVEKHPDSDPPILEAFIAEAGVAV
jgi:hypothetical protein